MSRTLTADDLVTVGFLGQLVEGRLGDASSKVKQQVQYAQYLWILWSESVAIVQLYVCKNEMLLVMRDALLVLDFGLDF